MRSSSPPHSCVPPVAQCRSRNSLLLTAPRPRPPRPAGGRSARATWARKPSRSGSDGQAAERGEVQLVEDLGVGRVRAEQPADPVVVGLERRRTASPLMSWNAWASVVASDRSHSQVSSRSGLPNDLQELAPRPRPGQLDGAEAARGVLELARACRAPGRSRRAGPRPAGAGPRRVREVRLVLGVRRGRAPRRAGTSATS